MKNILSIATVAVIILEAVCPVMGGEEKRCSGPKSEHDALTLHFFSFTS